MNVQKQQQPTVQIVQYSRIEWLRRRLETSFLSVGSRRLETSAKVVAKTSRDVVKGQERSSVGSSDYPTTRFWCCTSIDSCKNDLQRCLSFKVEIASIAHNCHGVCILTFAQLVTPRQVLALQHYIDGSCEYDLWRCSSFNAHFARNR